MGAAAARPGPKSARAWKAYYEAERETLGAAGLADLLERAPRFGLPPRGALIFPHTKATVSGTLIAAVARAVVDAGHDEVLALGVLHGAREDDAELVRRARAGDAAARGRLRQVHAPSSPHVAEEFSLDAFVALLAVAAERAGRPPPRVHARHPFLVGPTPADLPGLDELRALRARGCALLATTDPVHHGVGYGTAPAEARALDDPSTLDFARASVDAQLACLAAHDFHGFEREVTAARSDFRDVGPVLATLLEAPFAPTVHALMLVDYADALGTPSPTWVAAALVAAG